MIHNTGNSCLLPLLLELIPSHVLQTHLCLLIHSKRNIDTSSGWKQELFTNILINVYIFFSLKVLMSQNKPKLTMICYCMYSTWTHLQKYCDWLTNIQSYGLFHHRLKILDNWKLIDFIGFKWCIVLTMSFRNNNDKYLFRKYDGYKCKFLQVRVGRDTKILHPQQR